jgi:hypothetical protein
MNERNIFRNIQHVPRVWGVTYMRLFATLGFGLLMTTAGFTLSSGAGALGKVAVVGAGVVLTLAVYVVCLVIDKADALDHDHAPFLKGEMNSQSMSLQRIQLRGGRHAIS